MLDVQKLLGQFLGNAGAQAGGFGAGQGQQGHGQPRPSSGGSLGDTIGGLIRTHGASALSGGIAGGLASQLFKGKNLKKFGGTALKVGGAALVAGLAYKAYQTYQRNNGAQALPGAAPLPQNVPSVPQTALPAPEGTAFLPRGQEEARARLMLSAMIAAAKADGHIDAAEQEAIFGRIDELDLDPSAKGFVMDEMRRPLSIDTLVAGVSSPEAAIEVYTASVLAIDPDHPAERAYLDMLAARLNLPPELTAQIRRTAEEEVA
ncbi:protein YebE [Azorhizobium oxalatiphilum]|uniref:Protein YebE n=1 Tax=Azorhizobium oxalatiphilum TaxID=980631 RepID=A0A917BW65_9HYPH|nr:tellurite resistance TerB family protein [Azorhizobium oxalatiphilum]GGF57999.1 protein YebE [Azorhizobium oxalatiphilum]